MKKFSLLPVLFVIATVCGCKNKKPLHADFPESLTVIKSPRHERLMNSSIFVAAPPSFIKKVDENGVHFETGPGSRESILISRKATDKSLPVAVDAVKKELKGQDVLDIKPIVYNSHKGVFFETNSYNIYEAELRVPLPGKEVLRVLASYRGDSDPGTINSIFEAMQQVLFDENYVPDLVADKMKRLSIDTKGSRFRQAATDAVTGGNINYYFTANGEKYNAQPPYLWMFESPIILEGVSGNVKPGDYDFPSYSTHLAREGYKVQLRKAPYQISLPNHRVNMFDGMDEIERIPVSLLLYEVKHGETIIVMVGVADKGDDKTLAEFKKLAASLKIIE